MKMPSYDVRLIDDYYYVYLYLNEKEEEQPVMDVSTESDENIQYTHTIITNLRNIKTILILKT